MKEFSIEESQRQFKVPQRKDLLCWERWLVKLTDCIVDGKR